MISVIGACERWEPKSPLTQYEKFVRLVFRRPALHCSAMRMRTQSVTRGCRTAKYAGTRRAAICASKRLLPHCTEVVSGFLTKRSKLRVPLTSKLPTKNAHNGRATKLEAA
jgi:hypothetical protein